MESDLERKTDLASAEYRKYARADGKDTVVKSRLPENGIRYRTKDPYNHCWLFVSETKYNRNMS